MLRYTKFLSLALLCSFPAIAMQVPATQVVVTENQEVDLSQIDCRTTLTIAASYTAKQRLLLEQQEEQEKTKKALAAEITALQGKLTRRTNIKSGAQELLESLEQQKAELLVQKQRQQQTLDAAVSKQETDLDAKIAQARKDVDENENRAKLITKLVKPSTSSDNIPAGPQTKEDAQVEAAKKDAPQQPANNGYRCILQ